jgi:hypothetical protein
MHKKMKKENGTTFNQKMGITKEDIEYLAELFNHPSKIDEIEEIHNKKSELKRGEDFCQEPSKRYLKLLDEAGDDPRVAAGNQALKDLKKTGGWAPTLDARDARIVMEEN